jgi:hypothetical protein
VYVTVKSLPAHSVEYPTVTVAFRPETVLRERPVVRPVFLTPWPTDAEAANCEIVPMPRMAPLGSTSPLSICATAASMFPEPRAAQSDTCAT